MPRKENTLAQDFIWTCCPTTSQKPSMHRRKTPSSMWKAQNMVGPCAAALSDFAKYFWTCLNSPLIGMTETLWNILLEKDCFKHELTCFADQNVLMLDLTWQKNGCFRTASKQAPAIFCSQPPIRRQHNGTLIGPYRGCCSINENNFLFMNNR